ncbi:hypothetical protein KDL01_09105 [Actinospica durhamensis]|uniref:Uncharacterized protein n=1 Tax=Actinospica durhamensis TaxID=1508375 RepID=A0A941EMW8_9ACTN|nr:hypothetical protein [Actinospica durhamensis]MBR7833422.1 hypothetical protein [Actinospica durhamensis]
MNDPELNQGAPSGRDPNEAVTREVLDQVVASVHTSPDLAERVRAGGIARRRRTRWSATAAIALVAAGTAAGVTALGPGQKAASVSDAASGAATATASAGPVALPTCAAEADAYRVVEPRTAPTGPAVAGAPVAAVVCRYGPDGKPVRSATVTDPADVTALRTAANAGTPYAGSRFCLQGFGSAVIVFVYAQGSPRGVAVTYDPACDALETKAGSYDATGALDGLITGWVGDWRASASPTG